MSTRRNRPSSLLAVAALCLAGALPGCPPAAVVPTRGGAVRTAALRTSLTLREHKVVVLPGGKKPEAVAGTGSKLAPAFEDPRIAKSYGFTAPPGVGGRPAAGAPEAGAPAAPGPAGAPAAAPPVSGAPPAAAPPATASPAAAPPAMAPPAAAPPAAAGKQTGSFPHLVQQMLATRQLATRADQRFLEVVTGKLPFTVSKDRENPDAVIELEIKEERLVPPSDGKPGVVILGVALRMRTTGEVEEAFEREEQLSRPSPELGEAPGVLEENPAAVFDALGAAVEESAGIAAGWLVEAHERGDPPAAPGL